MATRLRSSATTAGAQRRATAMYRQRGGGTATQRAYTAGANRALQGGSTQMGAHRAGLQSAGMS